MEHFVVDERLCRKDGICVAVCPVGILEAREDGGPRPVRGAGLLCIACGHCVAACPHGAFSLRAMPAERCPPVRPEWRLDPERAEHFLRSRRSIRVYRDEQVEPGRIERLIRIARYAPSGVNRQPVRWTVHSGRERVRELAGRVAAWMRAAIGAQPEMARAMGLGRVVAAWDAGKDRICHGAPHLVAAHAPREDRTAPTSCTLALAYLELAAPALGLGACWAGYVHMGALNAPPVAEALALPEGHALCGAMLLGVPKHRYHRLPERREPVIDWR